MSPVRRHLAAAGVRIVGGAHGFQQLLVRRHAQRQAERAVAVVRIEPVVARPHRQSGGDQQRLVPGAGDLEEDLLLALQQDLAIVQLARQIHQAVDVDQLLCAKALHICHCFSLHNGSLGLCFGGCHPLPQSRMRYPSSGKKT